MLQLPTYSAEKCLFIRGMEDYTSAPTRTAWWWWWWWWV